MALDATVAGIAADSYVTVDEADAMIFDQGWMDLTTPQKEMFLKMAVKVIERQSFIDHRLDWEQALSFPLSIHVDGSGNAFLPDEVKWEQARLANEIRKNIVSDGEVKTFRLDEMTIWFDNKQVPLFIWIYPYIDKSRMVGR